MTRLTEHGLVLAEVLILFLQLAECGGKTADNGLIGELVDIGLDDKAEVEDELVAEILGVCDDNWIAKDGVFTVGGVDGHITVAERLAGDYIFLQNIEVY